jgi:hypothetical protein
VAHLHAQPAHSTRHTAHGTAQHHSSVPSPKACCVHGNTRLVQLIAASQVKQAPLLGRLPSLLGYSRPWPAGECVSSAAMRGTYCPFTAQTEWVPTFPWP